MLQSAKSILWGHKEWLNWIELNKFYESRGPISASHQSMQLVLNNYPLTDCVDQQMKVWVRK